jgi:hypothetical protein
LQFDVDDIPQAQLNITFRYFWHRDFFALRQTFLEIVQH